MFAALKSLFVRKIYAEVVALQIEQAKLELLQSQAWAEHYRAHSHGLQARLRRLQATQSALQR